MNSGKRQRNPNIVEPKGSREKEIVPDRNSRRVALVSPQVVGGNDQVRRATPPLGQAYLAGVLEAKGHAVMLLDAAADGYDDVVRLDEYIASDITNYFSPTSADKEFTVFGLPNKKIIERLKIFGPDIVGVSSLFSCQTECAFSIVKAVKSEFPGLPIIMGGNHTSQQDIEILSAVPEIDFIISGEADFVFSEFVQKYLDGENYTTVPGLVWRDGNTIRKNNRPPFNRDLDVCCSPLCTYMIWKDIHCSRARIKQPTEIENTTLLKLNTQNFAPRPPEALHSVHPLPELPRKLALVF